MKKIIIVSLLLLLSSCDPYRRLMDYCTLYPDKCTRYTKDSVLIRTDHYDTLVSLKYFKDSVFYFDSVSRTLVKKYYFKDSFFTTLKSKPCTTYIKQNVVAPIKTEKENIWKQIGHFVQLFGLIVGLILLIFAVLWILK